MGVATTADVYSPTVEADPVGTVEISDRAKVPRKTVDAWRVRHDDFPKPRWTVGGRPAWEGVEVLAWLRDTGRDKYADNWERWVAEHRVA